MDKLQRDEEAKYLIQIAKEEERKAFEREEKRIEHIKRIQNEQSVWLKEQINKKQD